MYCDSHCHLDGYEEDQLVTLLENASNKEVEMIVGVGTTLEASEIATDLSRRFPNVVPAVGVHPWWAIPLEGEALATLKRLAGLKGVVAIGEVGIDSERYPDTVELQWQSFRQEVALAKELGLPLLLHCRGDRPRMLEYLRSQGAIRGVLHGFTGDSKEAGGWMDLGLYIGIGLRAFTRDPSPAREEAIASIPLDRILLETDSSPRSYASEEAMEPARVVDVAQKVARLHGVSAEEVGRRTTANVRALLGM